MNSIYIPAVTTGYKTITVDRAHTSVGGSGSGPVRIRHYQDQGNLFAGIEVSALISPDNWNLDFSSLQKPNAHRIQMDFLCDYRSNVALYPKWQGFPQRGTVRRHYFLGAEDIFFTPEGGEAYLPDLPKAEMHRLEAGYFAVEDCRDYIHRSYREVVAHRAKH